MVLCKGAWATALRFREVLCCSASIVVCLTCARHAQVEGPFTWEQMRHWLQAGYFDTDKLLVRNPRVQRGTYQHFSEAFPDSKRAFLPASMGDRIAAAAAAVGSDGGGGVGSPGRASGAGLYVASCSLCLLVLLCRTLALPSAVARTARRLQRPKPA